MHRRLEDGRDLYMSPAWREVDIDLPVAPGAESLTLRFKPPFQATAICTVSQDTFLLAGTDSFHVFVHLISYDYSPESGFVTMDEELVFSSSSHAAIDAISLVNLRGEGGFAFLDAFDGAVVWVSLATSESVQIIGADRCPELKEMVDMEAHVEEGGRLLFVLRSTDSCVLDRSDHGLRLLDYEADGVIDSIERLGY